MIRTLPRSPSIRALALLLPLLALAALLGCVKGGGAPPAGSGPAASGVAPGQSTGLSELHTIYGEDPNVVKGGTANYAVSSDPETLNVLTSKSATAANFEGFYLFPPLLQADPDTFELEPWVAEALPTISEDKLEYTFRLRPDVRWTDGTPVTSKDVVFTWKTIQDPLVDAAPTRAAYDKVKDVVAIDDRTFKFVMKEPYFRSLRSLGAFQMMPAHLAAYKNAKEYNESPLGRAPVGYGPYKLVKWETNKEVVFERNDDFFKFHDPGYFEKYYNICRKRYKIISESKVVFQLFTRGELDTVAMGTEEWQLKAQTPDFEKIAYKFEYYLGGMNYIGWNNKSPYFSDKRVRRAMTMLTQREAILKNLLYGRGKLATNPFYLYSPEYNSDIQPIPYDPEGAKKLLDEAGWKDTDGDGIRDKDGVKFEFELVTTQLSEAWAQGLADTLKEDLRKAGIVMTIRTMEWAAFLDRLYERKFQACWLGLRPTVADADPYSSWHSSQCAGRGQNHTCYSNPEVDKILEDARQEFDPQKRIAMYHRFSEILDADQPWTFLFVQPSNVAVSKKYRNVQIHKMGTRDHEWFIPKELQTEDCGSPLPAPEAAPAPAGASGP